MAEMKRVSKVNRPDSELTVLPSKRVSSWKGSESAKVTSALPLVVVITSSASTLTNMGASDVWIERKIRAFSRSGTQFQY